MTAPLVLALATLNAPRESNRAVDQHHHDVARNIFEYRIIEYILGESLEDFISAHFFLRCIPDICSPVRGSSGFGDTTWARRHVLSSPH